MAEDNGTAAPGGFSEAALQKALHDESCNSPEEGWSLVSRAQFTEVWRKHCPNETVHLIKGFLHLPGVSPEDVVKMIHDLELRKRWDTQFPVIDVLEEHPTHRVVYWLVHMPLGVQNRDLVQYISERRDESTNTTYILYNNAPEDIVPPKPGIVRAATIQSATIIRPDPADPGSTRMTVLLQNDTRGWIPKFIVNEFAARAPGQWRDSLYNFYVNVYSKEKLRGDKEVKESEGSLPTQGPAEVEVQQERLQTTDEVPTTQQDDKQTENTVHDTQPSPTLHSTSV